jgi:hypothetical protein
VAKGQIIKKINKKIKLSHNTSPHIKWIIKKYKSYLQKLPSHYLVRRLVDVGHKPYLLKKSTLQRFSALKC